MAYRFIEKDIIWLCSLEKTLFLWLGSNLNKRAEHIYIYKRTSDHFKKVLHLWSVCVSGPSSPWCRLYLYFLCDHWVHSNYFKIENLFHGTRSGHVQPRKLRYCIWRDLIKPNLRLPFLFFSCVCVCVCVCVLLLLLLLFISKGNLLELLLYSSVVAHLLFTFSHNSYLHTDTLRWLLYVTVFRVGSPTSTSLLTHSLY